MKATILSPAQSSSRRIARTESVRRKSWRRKRADQHGRAERGDQHADAGAREPVALGGDHQHEQDARDREVAEAVEERAGAQERPVPEKAEPLRDLRPQARGVDLTLLLERRPHQREREERERVGDGVEEERHGAAEREERASERRPGEHHHRRSRRG